MSLCDTCRQPGHCCSGFVLSTDQEVTYWDDWTREQINADIEVRARWPFRIIAIRQRFVEEGSGRAYNGWYFGCPALGPDGRCTRYDERPDLCRAYEAGSSPLCIEHVPAAQQLKDIPIQVEHA